MQVIFLLLGWDKVLPVDTVNQALLGMMDETEEGRVDRSLLRWWRVNKQMQIFVSQQKKRLGEFEKIKMGLVLY